MKTFAFAAVLAIGFTSGWSNSPLMSGGLTSWPNPASSGANIQILGYSTDKDTFTSVVWNEEHQVFEAWSDTSAQFMHGFEYVSVSDNLFPSPPSINLTGTNGETGRKDWQVVGQVHSVPAGSSETSTFKVNQVDNVPPQQGTKKDANLTHTITVIVNGPAE